MLLKYNINKDEGRCENLYGDRVGHDHTAQTHRAQQRYTNGLHELQQGHPDVYAENEDAFRDLKMPALRLGGKNDMQTWKLCSCHENYRGCVQM